MRIKIKPDLRPVYGQVVLLEPPPKPTPTTPVPSAQSPAATHFADVVTVVGVPPPPADSMSRMVHQQQPDDQDTSSDTVKMRPVFVVLFVVLFTGPVNEWLPKSTN